MSTTTFKKSKFYFTVLVSSLKSISRLQVPFKFPTINVTKTKVFCSFSAQNSQKTAYINAENQFHADVLRVSRSERNVVKWTLLALLLTRRGKFTVRLICENLRTYSRCNARANFTVTR